MHNAVEAGGGLHPQNPGKGWDRHIPELCLPEDVSSPGRPAHPNTWYPKSGPPPGTSIPAISPVLQGASNFGIGQANINHRIDKLNVLTTINHYGCSACAGDTRSSQSMSMEASHTASCSSRTEPSQIITTVNTPSHQIRFEFNRSESKEPLGHCEESIHSPHDTAKVNRGSPQALLGPREATKQSVVEASTAPEDLVLIFGEEGAKGVIHVLSDFTFYQGERGAKDGRFLKLHTHFVPHYNASGEAEIKRLREPVQVTITKVVKSLRAAQKNAHHPLSFEAIRSTLAQLVYLEPRPERNVSLRRVVKIKEGKPVPGFLSETQWMIKLVESGVPESVLDSEVAPPVATEWRKGSVRKMYFGDQGSGWNEGQTDLVDLAVLTFPRLNVPRFKLSHLRLQVNVSKTTGMSAKRRADVILEYRTHFYGLRDGTTVNISLEARKRDCAYAYGLFL